MHVETVQINVVLELFGFRETNTEFAEESFLLEKDCWYRNGDDMKAVLGQLGQWCGWHRS